jgi:hypothetical protein
MRFLYLAIAVATVAKIVPQPQRTARGRDRPAQILVPQPSRVTYVPARPPLREFLTSLLARVDHAK